MHSSSLPLLAAAVYLATTSSASPNENTTNAVRMVYGDFNNMKDGWPAELGDLILCTDTADPNQKPPVCSTKKPPSKCASMDSTNRLHPIPNVFGNDDMASACSLAAQYCKEIYNGTPGQPGPLCQTK